MNLSGAPAVDRRVKSRSKWIGFAAVALVVAAALAVSGCGGSGSPARPDSAEKPQAFGWVRPSAVPSSWTTLRLPGSPARLPVPSGWHSGGGDAGTQTAELRDPSGEVEGYLNATPLQGKETLANWSDFRVDHNGDEGDSEIKLIASATGLRFPRATGSCVLDSYLTSSGHRYREVACIVAGGAATTVIVVAAPPQRWAAEAPTLERAVASFTT